jgi:hypothetical protein
VPDNMHRAKLPENSTHIILSGLNGLLINGFRQHKRHRDGLGEMA